MDWDKIAFLLEKYENAETTLAEEQFLKTVFEQESIPDYLQSYQWMFRTYSINKKESLNLQIKLKKSVFDWKYFSIAGSIVLFFQ